MVAAELGTCEWFVWDLRRSNLLDRGQLDQVVNDFLTQNPRGEPQALAQYLVEKEVLTQFQAERLLAGKTQGFVLGPFTLSDALGAGSMGTVYKAQSKTDNQWYAVKVLPRRSMWNVRIARRKVRAFEQARHPSVIPFVDVGTTGGMHYLAWPYVEGQSLDKLVPTSGKINPGVAAHYALQIAEGLDICHRQGLIHGLLKPSNLLIGSEQQVYILDFGIGCLLAETEGESLVDTMSTANAVAAGLDCSSPESIMDPTKLTPAGDQYSLGCILYYMLTGQYPFPDGSAAEKMMAHQFKQPKGIHEISAEVPGPFVEIVNRLMQKTPEQRYASAADIVEALKPLVKGARVPPRPPMAPAPTREAAPEGVRAPVPLPSQSAVATPPIKNAFSTPRPQSIGVSAATPRPASIGSLPGRNTFRPTTQQAINVQTPVPIVPPQPPARPKTIAAEAPGKPGERLVPGSVPGFQHRPTLEERLGPTGITIAAVVACGLVYFVAAWLKVF